MVVLKGTNPGNIMDIPWVNKKWPSAVNKSITARAILPDRANSKLPVKILCAKKEMTKTVIKMSSGFISVILKQRSACPAL
jgi:hypothetical protein